MWNEMSNPAVLVKIGQRIKETRINRLYLNFFPAFF